MSKICEIFRNTYFKEHLQATASAHYGNIFDFVMLVPSAVYFQSPKRLKSNSENIFSLNHRIIYISSGNLKNHSFSTYAKFSGKLTFLTYVYVSGCKKC